MADPEKIELLKKQRAAFKGQLTYFKGQYNFAMTVGSFESLLRRIQVTYEKYGQVQSKLEALDDNVISDRESFEDEYGKLESTILNKIYELKRSDESTISASFQNVSMHENSDNSTASISIRLPELKLPSFSGKESEWLAFRDVFGDLIHKKNIDATTKFVYLISHIRAGSAYNLIENLPVTADNYEVAWKTICDRYNNEIVIQRLHMKGLYDVSKPQEKSSKSLQCFIDHVIKHYNALRSLKGNIQDWDLMLTHHLTERLDNSSRVDIIKGSKLTNVLCFDDFIKILKTRVRLLESLHQNTSSQASNHTRQYKDAKKYPTNSHKSSALVSNESQCSYCSGSHLILDCPSFNDEKLSPQMRFQFSRNKNLCTNCLMTNHRVSECNKPPCIKCSLKHNIRLHFRNTKGSSKQSESSEKVFTGITNTHASKLEPIDSINNIITSNKPASCDLISTNTNSNNIIHGQSSFLAAKKSVVMLGTALVNATALNGNQIVCRALLDSGSHMNFITTNACNLLKATRQPTFKTISGIGGKETRIKHKIHLTLASRVSDYTVNLKFYVIPKISNELPSVSLNVESVSVPVSIKLADPQFNTPDRIDLLLGAEIYNQLFTGKSLQLCIELPPFHSTKFGYVVCGKAQISREQLKFQKHVGLCTIETLESQLKQFWELENIHVSPIYSSEERLCEEHYCKNVKRLACGRYSVALPVKPNIAQLGLSNQSARHQFASLENRLRNNNDICQQYRDFMQEYLDLGHMTPVGSSSASQVYYLPHHYVRKETSTTTKLRVVFNASAKTSSQLSLNDCLMVGPTIQQNLFAITLRFRKHIIAFCGDITKMYRQIQIHDNDQDLQRIWWRSGLSGEVQSFKLCTVTYGTASAPFLATRTLKQLSIDERDKYAEASVVLARDFYVDDVLTGCSTINEAVNLKRDLIKLLHLGGFELRKFSSNEPSISSDSNHQSQMSLILGLSWNTAADNFEMFQNQLPLSSHCTKRIMLSQICQLFDPLGLCAPLIVTAKLFMQTLWILPDISWDDPLPDIISQKWIKFKTELRDLEKVSFKRCILIPNYTRVELHGFGDASERAFGCVFYIRVTDGCDRYLVNLLCAKSRVAPLKKQSIPRLELCAALLVAEMTTTILDIMEISFDAIFLWSDSEVTLFRIKSEPHKYATFVANRLAKIQECTSSNNWHYVNSSSNPADYVSRGLMPSEFVSANLWWSGPDFLYQHEPDWPKHRHLQFSSDVTNLDFVKHRSLF